MTQLVPAKRRFLRIALVLLLLLFYSVVSEWLLLDLTIAEFFFEPDAAGGGHWLGDGSGMVNFFYHAVSVLVVLTSLGALLVLAYCARRGCRSEVHSSAVLVLLSLIIGAGLIVNSLLKEHWGRPRPKQTIEFSGSMPYQPPVLIASSSGHSFPSGHVAASFSLLAVLPFFPGSVRNRRLLGVAIVGFGAGVAYARMAAGGHYFTDVLWGAVLAWLVVELLTGILGRRLPRAPGPSLRSFMIYLGLLGLAFVILIYRVTS